MLQKYIFLDAEYSEYKNSLRMTQVSCIVCVWDGVKFEPIQAFNVTGHPISKTPLKHFLRNNKDSIFIGNGIERDLYKILQFLRSKESKNITYYLGDNFNYFDFALNKDSKPFNMLSKYLTSYKICALPRQLNIPFNKIQEVAYNIFQDKEVYSRGFHDSRIDCTTLFFVVNYCYTQYFNSSDCDYNMENIS